MASIYLDAEESGASLARIARLSDIPARKLYNTEPLSPEEETRVRIVLADLRDGRVQARPRAER